MKTGRPAVCRRSRPVYIGIVLGVALTQWPYAQSCGLPLFLYVAAVGALALAGGWAGVSAWNHRLGVAHNVSLVLVFWGIVLASEQILPRVGYARTEETWLCTGADGRWFPSEEIVDEPSTPDAAPTTPSAQLKEPAAEPAVPPLPESEVVP